MATAGQAFENPVTGERMVVGKTTSDINGTNFEIEFFVKPRTGTGLPAHIHPYFDERFEIVSGSAAYVVGKAELTAKAGDVVVLSKGIRHIHPWNAGDDVLHMRHTIQFPKTEKQGELDPPAFFETLYALAQQGKIGEDGLPKNFLQKAVLARALQPGTYAVELPIWIQPLLFGVLAAIGRALGYKAYYPAVSAGATAS